MIIYKIFHLIVSFFLRTTKRGSVWRNESPGADWGSLAAYLTQHSPSAICAFYFAPLDSALGAAQGKIGNEDCTNIRHNYHDIVIIDIPVVLFR